MTLRGAERRHRGITGHGRLLRPLDWPYAHNPPEGRRREAPSAVPAASRSPAARGANATPILRRVRRTGAPRRRTRTAAPVARARPPGLAPPVGPARDRQDDPRPPARGRDRRRDHRPVAVLSGVAEVRGAIAEAQERLTLHGPQTVLFIDEIHRFNKAQQDALLPHVEDGTVTLIGATTENPYFEVNAALLSRMRVWRLEPLTDEEVGDRRPPGARPTPSAAWPGALGPSGGVALDRRRLRAPRLARRRRRAGRPQRARGRDRAGRGRGRSATPTATSARDSRTSRPPPSSGSSPTTAPATATTTRSRAFIKSLRGNDPDAALYWLAAMIAAGEDPQVHRPPADHQRLRGRRQRRPAGAPGRGRGRPGARLDRPAGGAVRAGAGDDLHRDRPEVEPLGRRLLGGRLRRRGAAARCRSRSTCATPPTAA